MRIKIIPTKSLGCWAVPLTPASPTIPIAKPAANPEKPTASPAPRWTNPLKKSWEIYIKNCWIIIILDKNKMWVWELKKDLQSSHVMRDASLNWKNHIQFWSHLMCFGSNYFFSSTSSYSSTFKQIQIASHDKIHKKNFHPSKKMREKILKCAWSASKYNVKLSLRKLMNFPSK